MALWSAHKRKNHLQPNDIAAKHQVRYTIFKIDKTDAFSKEVKPTITVNGASFIEVLMPLCTSTRA